MKNWLNSKKEQEEKGVIIIEATLVLPLFIFAMLIILSLVDICYVQTKMAVALNSAAKEMSHYGYLYTTLQLDEHMSGEGGKSSEILDSLGEVLNTIGEKTGIVSDEISSLFNTTGNIASGDSASEYIKDIVGMQLAKALVQKNLVTYKDDTAERFLRRNHVVDGVDGLDFLFTSFLTNQEQDEVDIIVSYEVEVLRLLNIEFKFRFLQRAHSKVWGKGISLIDKGDSDSENDSKDDNLWNASDFERGKKIVAEEKKGYTYVSDSYGFHAYDKQKNEFIKIISIDTNHGNAADPVEGQKNIEKSLKTIYSRLYTDVGFVKDSVTLKDSGGNDVVVNTPEEGRTYRIVLIVPDDADMATVRAAAAEFERERAELGSDVKVEIRTGYGNSKSEPAAEEKQEDKK